MNSWVIAFFAILATTNASTITPNAKIIEGPGSKTTLTGPDGSVISSATTGGQVVIDNQAGEASQVLATAPQLTAYASAPLSPAVVAAAPILAYSAPAVAAHPVYASPIVTPYAGAVVGQSSVDTLVSGPSGTVSSSKTVAGPAVVPAPVIYTQGVHGLYL